MTSDTMQASGDSSWEHPRDGFYKEIYRQKKASEIQSAVALKWPCRDGLLCRLVTNSLFELRSGGGTIIEADGLRKIKLADPPKSPRDICTLSTLRVLYMLVLLLCCLLLGRWDYPYNPWRFANSCALSIFGCPEPVVNLVWRTVAMTTKCMVLVVGINSWLCW